MNNFFFQLRTKVYFGKGQIARIADEVPSDKTVLVAYGQGSALKNGVLDQVRKALLGRRFHEFGGIEPNAPFDSFVEALPLIREREVDYLVAVGGGSVIDGVKFLSVAAAYEDQDDLWEIMRTNAARVKRALPIGAVLTLSATASAMNNGCAVSRRDIKEKLEIITDKVIPKFAILDPEATFSVSPYQTANGIADAFAHTVEQYMTYPCGAFLTDRFAEAVFSTLLEQGPIAMKEPGNYDARANLMWASNVALNWMVSLGNPGDWLSHGISIELTPMFGLDHGRCIAIVMPRVLEYELDRKKAKLAQFGRTVLHLEGSDDEALARAAVKGIYDFFQSLGMQMHLSDYGIGERALFEIMPRLEAHGAYRRGEHHDIKPEQMKEILRMCL